MPKGAGWKTSMVPRAPMTSMVTRVPMVLGGVPDEHLGGIGGVKDADDTERREVEAGPEDADGTAVVDDVDSVADVTDIGRDFGGGRP